MSSRYQDLLAFLKSHNIPCSDCDPCDCGCQCSGSLTQLNGDASFRRYYRLKLNTDEFTKLCETTKVKPRVAYVGSIIIMDAPPETQKNQEFVALNRVLDHANVLVPAIFISDLEHGFMVLEDMGDFVYINSIPEGKEPAYYFKTIRELTKIGAMPLNQEQALRLEEYRTKALNDPNIESHVLPKYKLDEVDYQTLAALPNFDDDFIKMELNICTEWLFEKTLKLNLTQDDKAMLDKAYNFISQSLQSQPQVAMHRDYHSRNIMVTPAGNEISILSRFAILDYQDMVKGPIAYDLASIGYDCYVDMEDDFAQRICGFAYEVYSACGIFDSKVISREQFKSMILICAIERHIKVLGLFNRLNLRDGKSGYLQYLPRVLNYVLKNCDSFAELKDFKAFLEQHVQGKI
ncbi:phosphotransferase [Anaerobiospirillum sp. NML120448]|uniref:aminoglycoside phosphotransferase family protein n=1 Tax=Anaerobiospirillum sp. NML120448 TaxID=2932816 RepID=UPI001FF1589D|nr:phosphotransferase [Anaerobiospirillum sp. NML120448]